MTKEQLIELINTKNPSIDKIRNWVQLLPKSNKIKPSIARKGDVYMHPIFQHPYILLEKRDDYWICGLLTTESSCPEILEPCRSRFYESSYFTKTLITFKEPHGNFLSTYENPNHLRNILLKLKQHLL